MAHRPEVKEDTHKRINRVVSAEYGIDPGAAPFDARLKMLLRLLGEHPGESQPEHAQAEESPGLAAIGSGVAGQAASSDVIESIDMNAMQEGSGDSPF